MIKIKNGVFYFKGEIKPIKEILKEDCIELPNDIKTPEEIDKFLMELDNDKN